MRQTLASNIMIDSSHYTKLVKKPKFQMVKAFLIRVAAVVASLVLFTVFSFAGYLNYKVCLLVPEVRTVSQNEAKQFMERFREVKLGEGSRWGNEDYVTTIIRQKILSRDPKFPTKNIPHYLRVYLLNWYIHLSVPRKLRDASFVENLLIVPGKGRKAVGLRDGSFELFGTSVGDLNKEQVRQLIQIAHQGHSYWLRDSN
jgi:hypothetical protein